MSIQEIKTRIHKAATVAGRNADDISLIAVSKVQPNERVQAVLETGHTTFGENRVQEALSKWPDFQQSFGELGRIPRYFHSGEYWGRAAKGGHPAIGNRCICRQMSCAGPAGKGVDVHSPS